MVMVVVVVVVVVVVAAEAEAAVAMAMTMTTMMMMMMIHEPGFVIFIFRMCNCVHFRVIYCYPYYCSLGHCRPEMAHKSPVGDKKPILVTLG
ncbi:hypothetical protein DPMN_009329 [Dreissena polymorpha]|uniref:Secreted protein n=1 Tax=Dreissena polymorpha TaxID=45954 RepID=A0A9D4MXV3_DREPO|nr:hypothetical protein DPMN_009329 [Dreissena polymorpha]